MRFNYNLRASILAVVLLVSTGVKAQKQITSSDMPQAWQYTEIYQQTLPSDDLWWKGFADSTLDSLIAIGISNNYDVLTAKHRIEIASQTLRQTQSQYFPTIGINAGWSAQRSSGVMSDVTTEAVKTSYFDLGATMNWQIDIFGKISEQAKQSRASLNVSRIQYDGMMVTVSANIAKAYMQLRMLQAEMAVLSEHITQQKRVADITQARHEAGLASMLDVTQSLTTYYSTLATITSLKSSIATTINGLAVLVGVFPQDIEPWLSKTVPMPDYHRMIAVGIPADLLRRRPDVAEAEYTLAGYAAALGIAKKDFLPTLSLSGSVGTMSHKVDNLFSDKSFTYSIAPTLSWTLFDGLSRKAAVASAKEQMMAGIDSYNNTILTAVQEVENSMTTYYNDILYIDMVTKVVEQAAKSFELSIDLYKQGLTDFINVTNSQISFLQYSNELVTAQGQALVDVVSVYEALGGGWSL